jgi:hypothetical protein
MRTVQYYRNILDSLRVCVANNIHIAGGAVRDTILERPIKDIDIFLPHDAAEAAANKLRYDFGYVKVGEWQSYEGFSDQAITGVAKFESAHETIPICLIGLKKDLAPAENIARFDFGICMAGWAGDGIIKDPRFTRDIESKTFTLCRADNKEQFAYSMVRFTKLTADRYQGWTLSVLSQFEALAREHTFNKHWYRDGGHFGLLNLAQTLHPKER